MSFSALFGVLLSVVSLSTLVVGDPKHVLEITNWKIDNFDNDILGEITSELKESNKGTLMGITIPVKKNAEKVKLTFNLVLPEQDPISNTMDLGSAVDDKTMGEEFVSTMEGQKLPPDGSIPPGEYSFKDYKASLDSLPSGAQGEMSGSVIFEDEETGTKYCELTFAGEFYPKPDL